MYQWVTVIGLSMTPALIAGQSAALAVGIGFGFPPFILNLTVVISSFIGGLLTILLADLSANLPLLKKWLKKFQTEKVTKWCQKWGIWWGLIVGVAFIGPIPILLTLRWMGVERKKLLIPLAMSSVLYTLLYYALISFGFEQWEQYMDLM